MDTRTINCTNATARAAATNGTKAAIFLNLTVTAAVEGTYIIGINTTNSTDGVIAANTNSSAAVLLVDSTAPTLTITTDPTSPSTTKTSLVYTFTFSEAVTGFAAADITLDFAGAGAEAVDGATFATTSSSVYTLTLDGGNDATDLAALTRDQTVVASVAMTGLTDIASNKGVGTTSKVWSYDVTAPNIVLNGPVQGYNSSSRTMVFQYTVSDNTSATLSCALNLSGNGITSYQRNASVTNGSQSALTNLTLTDGAYYWSINCTDGAGNTNRSAVRNFTVDTIAPQVTINYPVSSAIMNGANGLYNVTVNVTDSNTTISSVKLQSGASGSWTSMTLYSGTSSDGLWTVMIDPASFSNGGLQLTINATDFAGGQNTTVGVNVTINNVAAATPITGGGGGGSVSTGEQTVTIASVPAGVPTSLTYSDKLLPVQTIVLTADTTLSNVKIGIKNLVTVPAGVSAPTGTVYKYMQVSTQNLADQNIDEAKIKFKVNKTWYVTSNLDPATTKLNRYDNGVWTVLITVQTSSDSDYYYFEAETPGFSTFVITAAAPAAAPAVTTCTTTCPTGQSQRAYPDCTCYTPTAEGGEPSTTEEAAPNYELFIYLVVAAIIILVAVYAISTKSGKRK